MENRNSYTVEEAAKLKSRTPQFIREQIKAGNIPGCTAIKIGSKNWSYDIPKLAFDNHLRGANAIDVEIIKEVVKEAVKEVFNDLVEKEVERRLKTI